MSDLPEERIGASPVFTFCGCDFFGPFAIKEGQKEIKRYGIIFTCMASRAIRLEVANSLDTDSFINGLRRFESRQGPERQTFCDRGTNFIGAQNELTRVLIDMNDSKIKEHLLHHNCDWIEFKFNFPMSSHMGGVWERQIRTVRSVLSSLRHSNSNQLNDECLRTLFCEVEAVVNSRPLTTDNLTDSDAFSPVTPNHLLTMKFKIVLPPPGVFESPDLYCRKQWRRVQHLTNEFWSRWRKEFLLSLPQRQKWNQPRRNLQVGDIVIVKVENLPRNQWQLAMIDNVYPSKDGQVRKVRAMIGSRKLDNHGKRLEETRYLDRPACKLVLIMPVNE